MGDEERDEAEKMEGVKVDSRQALEGIRDVEKMTGRGYALMVRFPRDTCRSRARTRPDACMSG
jgi:hypothetical protein